jgi:beta-glucosidase-like glycosyl hydrolase/CubicO group peptidase (beta-lactamase class C family)
MKIKKSLIFLAVLLWGHISYAQVDLEKLLHHPWVDSVFNSLTPEQRVGQLIWIDVTAKNNLSKQLEDAELIKKYGFGGIIFFEGEPVTQANLTNFYQSISTTPLVAVMDAEWGIGMRLPGIMPLPYNMALGATGNIALVREASVEMARQMKRIGINIALGPSCDINTEPMNPIIGMRSFGESRKMVTDFSIAAMQALQENGVMATAKHYPGHGDTQTDSHLMLPLLPYSRERIDSLELYPFRQLSKAGIGCIMTAHLNVPDMDSTRGIPSSLSPKIIDQILHKEWQFKGLVITDAMNMRGVKDYENPGRLEVLALKAGNDVVEYPADPELAVKSILSALKTKELSQEDLNLKCRKVLAAKLWCGLNRREKIETANLIRDLNTPMAELTKRKIIESSLTLLTNKNEIIPIGHLEDTKIAALSIGSEKVTPFQKMLAKYTKVDLFQLRHDFSDAERVEMQKKLSGYDLVVAGIHSMYESKLRQSLQVGILQKEKPVRPYGVTDQLDSLFTFLASKQKTIAVLFASPYGLGEIRTTLQVDGLLVAYQNDTLVQELSAQLIFGGIAAKGKLPVSVAGKFKVGDGLEIKKPIRLKYTIPEEVGIQSALINRQIDSIVSQAIDRKAFPGCNVLVAKDSKIIFRKAYGFHTYDKMIPEKEDDFYDLASVTKITGGLPAWLKLYDDGKINPDEYVSTYYPEWKNRLFHRSNKSDITVRELLSHQSGLTPFFPFWKKSLKGSKLSPKWYAFEPDQAHGLQVARGMYLDNRFPKTVFKTIRKSALKNRGKYVYSDLPFVLTPKITSGISGKSFVEELNNNFYKPLGAYRITYNPMLKFKDDEIIPTENDNYYRNQQLLGTVHDESAAVLGGISGNAGLFATANDLAKLYQMYLQMGNYGGKQYLKESTMKEFSRVQFPQNKNRRGLGFDKPSLNNAQLSEKEAYPIKAASPESFGHSGYTGTFVWIDPKYGLVYIFLSNRVFPTRDNNKISEMNVRTEIQRIIYNQMSKN